MWEFRGDLRLVAAAYYAGDRWIGQKQLNYRNPDVFAYVETVRRQYLMRKQAAVKSPRRNKMKLRWLIPIAVLLPLRLGATEPAVSARVATITINPNQVTALHLRPEFESTIRMPEEITSYAIGDRVVVPAGARIYGKLVPADRSGLVNVEFDEIRLLDGARDEKLERIDAIGLGLDLGPIKGDVSGKNTGKNFLVRAASGMGSVLAEIAGNNSSAAFSEDDMLRERLAENIGTAGDSEVMNLNANSRIVVTVPADTKIYVVFTKRQEKNSSELHKVSPATP